jgi:hypothetical protein
MIYRLCAVEVETVAVPVVCLQFTLLEPLCDWCVESGVTLAVLLSSCAWICEIHASSKQVSNVRIRCSGLPSLTPMCWQQYCGDCLLIRQQRLALTNFQFIAKVITEDTKRREMERDAVRSWAPWGPRSTGSEPLNCSLLLACSVLLNCTRGNQVILYHQLVVTRDHVLVWTVCFGFCLTFFHCLIAFRIKFHK